MNCTGTHCVTCADEGIPMRVIEADVDGLAWCDDGRSRVEVMTALVGAVARGDVLLVHAGTALARLTEADAAPDVPARAPPLSADPDRPAAPPRAAPAAESP